MKTRCTRMCAAYLAGGLALASLIGVGCGGPPESTRSVSGVDSALIARFADVDPLSLYEPIGGFTPGRFTIVYQPVELYDEAGERLHPAVDRADRKALIEYDRAFIFETRPTPLKGLGGQVNLLLRREPVKVTLNAKAVRTLAGGAKASDVVNIWRPHNELTALVLAHPGWFGHDPQTVYQIPHGLRDQATWFRFDRAADLATTVASAYDEKEWTTLAAFVARAQAERGAPPSFSGLGEQFLSLAGPEGIIDAAFPKLRVPLVWHAVGAGKPGLSLAINTDVGAPRSSVILFHELGHIGTCRASDGYSEANAEAYLADNPREAAVVELLGRTLKPGDLAKVIEARMPGPSALRERAANWIRKTPWPDEGVNISAFLLRNQASQRMVGKVLGEPNVLPDDPKIIEEVWMSTPGFKSRLWREEDGRAPREGDVRVISGGLYLADRAFVRMQVYDRGDWRNDFMAESGNPHAPAGPVLTACLERLADRIRAGAAHRP